MATPGVPVTGTVVGFAVVTPKGERFESDTLHGAWERAPTQGSALYVVIQPQGQDHTEEQRISARKGDRLVKLTCACGKTEWIPEWILSRAEVPVTQHSYQCTECGVNGPRPVDTAEPERDSED